MSPWGREFWRLGLLLAVPGAVAAYIAEPAWGLCIGLGLYLGWHLWQLRRFELWLAGKGKRLNDRRSDIWAEVAAQVLRIKRRSQKRKRRLSSILKQFLRSTAALPDGTVVLSADSRIIWFNQSAQRLLGLRSPQDNGQWVANLIRTPAFIRYLDSGNYDEAVEIISAHDPDRALSLQIVPYAEDQRLLVVRDATRERRLDQVRKDFVANASHELRTPLTVLSGYVEMLLDEVEEGELSAWAAPLTAMREQTGRMQQLLTDLLLLSRLDESPHGVLMRPVDLALLLHRCCVEAERMAAGKINIQAEIPDVLVIKGVEGELRSIFDNLLSNAIKYTPAGGTVRLDVTVIGEELQIAVIDTGMGISPEHLPRLTERFYRVDGGRGRDQGGIGLGLAIVKHALQRHDAHLSIESQLGKGSRFTCHFPSDRLLDGNAMPGSEPCASVMDMEAISAGFALQGSGTDPEANHPASVSPKCHDGGAS